MNEINFFNLKMNERPTINQYQKEIQNLFQLGKKKKNLTERQNPVFGDNIA